MQFVTFPLPGCQEPAFGPGWRPQQLMLAHSEGIVAAYKPIATFHPFSALRLLRGARRCACLVHPS